MMKYPRIVGWSVVITMWTSCGVGLNCMKTQEQVSYNHDEVYNTHKDRFEAMNCFAKYKSYTNSNAIPAFARDLTIK